MESPVFCRECGALATLSWKLTRPSYRSYPHPLLDLVFHVAEPEQFEVGWCEEHWRPLPATAEEVVKLLEGWGVALRSFVE